MPWKWDFWNEPLTLNAETRASAPGQFVELPDGLVHYEIAGPTDAQPVVLVHGFFTPCHTWDFTFAALVKAGFRVLRYDLYGRGFSDRPRTRYNADLFDRQLVDLLSVLKIEIPVDLIGFSMGGAISVVFTNRHPANIRKLGLIAPAGLSLNRTFKEKLVHVPLLGEILFRRHYASKGVQEKNREQMKYKGHRRALLSTVRYGSLMNLQETYAQVGKQQRPTILFWGLHDGTIPFETHEKVREAIPHLEFHRIHEAGHAPHNDQPEEVNPLLIEFLKRGDTW